MQLGWCFTFCFAAVVLRQFWVRTGSSHFTADRQALRQAYLPVLRQTLTQPLVTDAKEGIEQVVSTMAAYGLNREDWDSVQV